MVAYKSLKTKEKSSWVIPKVVAVAFGSGRLQELFIIKFKSQFKWGFSKVVVIRAGRLREWSQGELRLYIQSILSCTLNLILMTWSHRNFVLFLYRLYLF